MVCYFKLSAFISLVLNQDLVNDWKGLFPLVVNTSGITKIVIPKDTVGKLDITPYFSNRKLNVVKSLIHGLLYLDEPKHCNCQTSQVQEFMT